MQPKPQIVYNVTMNIIKGFLFYPYTDKTVPNGTIPKVTTKPLAN